MYLREIRHGLFYSLKKKKKIYEASPLAAGIVLLATHVDCYVSVSKVRHSPEAVLSVDLFLVDVGRLPARLDAVAVLPEVDEEVGDLARWRQEALQVESVVAGEAEASRRDDGRAELQTFLQTGS